LHTLPYLTVLIAYFHRTFTVFSTTRANYQANVALTLQPYIYCTSNTTYWKYWAWSWVKGKPAAINAHNCCLWESMFAGCSSSLRLQNISGLLLLLTETNNFIAGTSSHCSSRLFHHLVKFFGGPLELLSRL